MKILIMGAGAVGAYYGARLLQAGEDVTLCARGDHLRALQEHGLDVQSFKGDFQVKVRATGNPREFAPYDLILFAVKSYDTELAARQLKDCLAPSGILMTIQNGVENEELLCQFFPRECVMGGNSRVGAQIIAPGKLLHTALGVIEYGELDGRMTPRAEKLKAIFERAGILGELSGDLLAIRWYKLMGNNSTNSVSALTRTTLGQMLEDPDGYRLVRTLMLETLAVGRAEGAKVPTSASIGSSTKSTRRSTHTRSRRQPCRTWKRASRSSTRQSPGPSCARPGATTCRCRQPRRSTRC